MKIILVICDGMADRPMKDLDGRTPLQASNKPNLDKLALGGISGIVDPISPGVPPGSDTAHLALLGYDPYKYYQGRGAFEALGAGLDVKAGDISFRGNFASVDKNFVIVDRRAGRIQNGAEELAEAIDGIQFDTFPDVEVVVKHTVEHRLAVLLRGPRLSRMVSDSDPDMSGISPKRVIHLDESYESLRTAHIVNELTSKFHDILNDHPINIKRKQAGKMPANIVLLRGAGILPEVRSIGDIYGLNALVVAAGALYKGVARCVGMDWVNVPGATGDYNTDTIAKAKAAVSNLSKYDFILVHVKAADNAAHDGDPQHKIMMVEKIDALLGYLIDNADADQTFIAVTADHTTSTDLREHTGDPVPLTIKGPGVRKDKVQKYSELDCAEGGLGRIRGIHLTPILMDLACRSQKFGE